MGLLSADEITNEMFELALEYENAIAERDRLNRDADNKPKSKSGAADFRRLAAIHSGKKKTRGRLKGKKGARRG